MEINSDHTLLAVGRDDNSLEIWRTASWAVIQKYQLNKDEKIRKISWLNL